MVWIWMSQRNNDAYPFRINFSSQPILGTGQQKFIAIIFFIGKINLVTPEKSKSRLTSSRNVATIKSGLSPQQRRMSRSGRMLQMANEGSVQVTF